MSADTDETHQVGENSSTSLQMLHFKGWTTMGFLNGAGFRGWRRPSTTRWVASVTGSERSGGQSSAGRASLPSPRRWCDSAVGGCAIQSVSEPSKSTVCRVISHFINLKTRFRIQERFPSLQLCFGEVRKSHNIHVELLYTMIPHLCTSSHLPLSFWGFLACHKLPHCCQFISVDIQTHL